MRLAKLGADLETGSKGNKGGRVEAGFERWDKVKGTLNK
jgi:hypothetical protein